MSVSTMGVVSGPHGPRSGSGTLLRRAPFGHITVAGKAGDVTRMSFIDLYPKDPIFQQGILAQAIGGSVIIETTLAPADLALNPSQDVSGHWVVDTEVSPGAIYVLNTLSTALRITFTDSATLYLMGA